MMLALLGMPAILVLTVLVCLAFRRFWPGGVARPQLFLVITLTLALVVAAAAITWFAQPLVGVGIAGGSAPGCAAGALPGIQPGSRLMLAALFAVVGQYWVCRGTQLLLAR